MKKNYFAALAAACVVGCVGLGVSLTSAEDSIDYDPTQMFTKNSANIVYAEDGIHIGGPSSDAGQLWTNAGAYTFDDDLSITYRYDGMPLKTEGSTKINYFFLSDPDNGENLIWINAFVVYTGGVYQLRLNITYQDSILAVDNYNLGELTSENDSYTVSYDYSEKNVTFSYGETNTAFDLNYMYKNNAISTDKYGKVDKIPSKIKLSHMSSFGGIIVEKINGVSMASEAPIVMKNNDKDDIFTDPNTTAGCVTYTDAGAVISNGDVASGACVNAFVNSNYDLGSNLRLTFSFANLQPASAPGSMNKFVYFVVHDKADSSKRITFSMFAYCTDADEANAQYILHANANIGLDDKEQVIVQSKNLLWDVKSLTEMPITVYFNIAKHRIELSTPTDKKTISLETKSDSTAADLSLLPSGSLAMYSLVTNGAINIESINEHQLKFNRNENKVEYTENKDYFSDGEDTTAYVSYRNSGILVTNNAKSSVDYAKAFSSGNHIYNNTFIMEYKLTSLQVYNSSIPTSIMKGTWITLTEKNNSQKTFSVLPFIYKNGSTYMIHIHVKMNGNFTYQNYYLGIDLSASEAMDATFYFKYDSNSKKIYVGTTEQQKEVDLTIAYNGTNKIPDPDTSNLPQEEMMADFMVQFGGIYITRMNGDLFVIENPTNPDPVDSEITSFGLEDFYFTKTIKFTPEVNKNDFDDATLMVKYKGSEGEYVNASVEEDGSYTFTVDAYGTYEVLFILSYDGTEVKVTRSISIKSSEIQNITQLFTSGNGTISAVENGLKFSNNDNASVTMAQMNGNFSLAGPCTISYKLDNLQESSEVQSWKETWIEFSDGKNGLWLNIFFFKSATTEGSYYGYANVYYVPGGDKGQKSIYFENQSIGFNADIAGTLNENLVITISYNPYTNVIKISDENGEKLSHNLGFTYELPKNYSIITSVNYGAMIITDINGISLANTDGVLAKTPVPVVNECAIPATITKGESITISLEELGYSLMDLVSVKSLSVTGPDGEAVELKIVNGVATINFTEKGVYLVNVKVKDVFDQSAEKQFEVLSMEEDDVSPEIKFNDGAFSSLTATDNEYKYEAARNTIVSLPTPILSDNSGLAVSLVITVKDPTSAIVILGENNSFTLEKVGTYRIEYLATDMAGNTETYNITIVSKLKASESDDNSTDNTKKDSSTKKGCKGIIGEGTAMLVLATFGMAIMFRKKENK